MATATMESGAAAADSSLIMWMLQDAYTQLAGDVGWMLAALVCGIVGWHLSSWTNDRVADSKAQAKQVEKIEAANADVPVPKAMKAPAVEKAITLPAAKAKTSKTAKASAKAIEKPGHQAVTPPTEKMVKGKACKVQEKALEKPEEKVQKEVQEKVEEKISETAQQPTSDKQVERAPQPELPGAAESANQNSDDANDVSEPSVHGANELRADGPDIAVTGITEAAHLAQQGNYRSARKQIISTCRLLKEAMCTPAHQEAYLLFIERAEKIEEFMREREAQEKLLLEAAQAEAAKEATRLLPAQGSPDRLDPCGDDGWNECWDLVRRAPAWDDSEEAVKRREAHRARPATVEPWPKKEIVFAHEVPAPFVPKDPLEPENENVADLRKKHSSQLAKTELCKFFLWNDCNKGERCMFAHGVAEIQAKPDLSCTSMCQDFLETGNCSKPNCSFAHSEKSLRFTAGFFKTKMCRFAKSGRCKHGSSCGFAHDESELSAEALAKLNAETEQQKASGDMNSSADIQDAHKVQGKTEGKQSKSHGGNCTTIIVNNIPEALTQNALVSLLESLTPGFGGNFDFFYCPWDPQTGRNLGYCVINFLSPSAKAEFEKQWMDRALIPGQGTPGLKILPAALQGRAANLRHFSGFALAQNPDACHRPLVRAGAEKSMRPMAATTERDAHQMQQQQMQMQSWSMAIAATDSFWASSWGAPPTAWSMAQNYDGWH